MADVETVAEPQVASNEETPVPAPETIVAAETPAAEAEAPVEDGALGKRKLEEDAETEGEPQQKKSNFDVEVENGTENQPVMDAPAPAAEGEEAPVANPEEPAAAPVVQDICQQVPCPPTMVGRVIGKGGETIKSLEAQHGARIQIDQETKQINVTGTEQAVASTVAAVNELLTAPPEALATAPEASEALDCPAGLVGRIIGRGGETIKGLQAASQATISIDQNFPDGHPRKIHISGATAAVAHAKKLVSELLEGGPSTAAQLLGSQYGPGFSMDCPKEMVGRVIGRGGETIKGLQQHSGAKIQIDQTGNPCKVTMAGPPHAVSEAQRMITDIINGGSAAQYSISNAPQMGQQRGYGGYPAPGGYGAPGGYPPHGGYGYPQGGYGYPQGGYGAPGGYMPPAQGGYPQQYGGYGAPQDASQQAYGQQYQQSYATPASAAPAGDASAWQALQDNEGRTYYYNSTTGVSQWEKPEGMP